MKKSYPNTSDRKNDHIQLSLNDNGNYRNKTAGFELYDFEHYAATEVLLTNIDLTTDFFGNRIYYPFIISCMTGGTVETGKINEMLAETASELNIPVGVGSQRQALEGTNQHQSFKVLRQKARNVPILGNIGAAQFSKFKGLDEIRLMIDLIEADVMVVHLNPLQELIQKEGQTDFVGLIKNLEKVCAKITTPIIIKEVGAGIGPNAAKQLLNTGIMGIDVAGAGGTSWAGIETLRNGENESEFWDWGLPTTYCIRKISKLKKNHNFKLIASGGITDGFDIAKSIILGADYTAAAKPVLQSVADGKSENGIKLIKNWFEQVRQIMFLTGSHNLDLLKKKKLIKKKDLY
ncbi:MAG: type 2 isopentenyl-diphosphate Delta-isomerase [Melioribacteraceae bacterium]|nr:type 2 isopentenyl-diphosphate Delta-isomerase [Melioribacteraceae bacterium]